MNLLYSPPSLPKGGGAIRGIGESFQPQEFTGTAGLRIPVHTSPSIVPNQFPIERNLQNGDYSLTDIDGDGKLELVVSTPTRSGYYESHHDGTWEPYRSMAATPTELFNPQRQMVDVTGDGCADLL